MRLKNYTIWNPYERRGGGTRKTREREREGERGRGKETSGNVSRIVEALVYLPSVDFSRRAGHRRSVDRSSFQRQKSPILERRVAVAPASRVSKPRHSNYAAKLINRAADSATRIISVGAKWKRKKNSNVSQTNVSNVSSRCLRNITCLVFDAFCRSSLVLTCSPEKRRERPRQISPRSSPRKFRSTLSFRRRDGGRIYRLAVPDIPRSGSRDSSFSSFSFFLFFVSRGQRRFRARSRNSINFARFSFATRLTALLIVRCSFHPSVSSPPCWKFLPLPFFCLTVRFLIVGLRVRRLGKRLASPRADTAISRAERSIIGFNAGNFNRYVRLGYTRPRRKFARYTRSRSNRGGDLFDFETGNSKCGENVRDSR